MPIRRIHVNPCSAALPPTQRTQTGAGTSLLIPALRPRQGRPPLMHGAGILIHVIE
ncbi:MAG TPA: hypothetical protein VIO58_08630 [Candidatus Methanoperedens sp.]